MNNIALPKDFNFDDGPKSQNTHLKFYKEFNCIGSDCPLTCCKGWTISLDKKTFYKYKSDDRFKDHVSKGGNSGSRSSETFGVINRNEAGACELLEDNGLCKVHTLKGPDALSKTCATFPRNITSFSDTSTHKGLTLACPEAARLCISSEDAVALKHEIGQKNKLSNNIYIIGKNTLPALRANVFEATINFLTDATEDLWARLVAVGATIKHLDDATTFSSEDFSSLLDSSLASMAGDLDETYAGMFQLETYGEILFNNLSKIKKDDQFGQFVHASAIELGEGQVPRNEIFRRYFIAKKFHWKQYSLRYPHIIKNIIINDISNIMAEFGSPRERLLEVIQNIICRTSMIKFLLETNSNLINGAANLTTATVIISSVQRRFTHNMQMTKQLDMYLKSKDGDPFSLACTLIR